MFVSVNIVPALVLALSLIDHAVSQELITVSPDLPKNCPRTTRTTTSHTTIIAPACPTVTVPSGYIGCPVKFHCDIACPLQNEDALNVPVGCAGRCCPKVTPTVTVKPTCPPACGCPPRPTAYVAQQCVTED